MAEMSRQGKKRGILFSLAVLLLGTNLITMALFLSEQPGRASHTASLLMDMDRASCTYGYMEDSLARLISPSMNFSVENSTLEIDARLPWNPQVASDISTFELFEANYSDSVIFTNLTNLKNGSFYIQPYNISITQSDGTFAIAAPDPQAGQGIASYYVTLTFPPGSFDSAAWQSLSNSSADRVPVHVRVQDDGYAKVLDFYQNLDRSGGSVLNITSSGSLVGTVEFDPSSSLLAQYDGNIGLKASVGFTGPVHVETEDTMEVSHAANMSGKVRIA